MSFEDSEFLYHESCPSCGSKDNLARYSDGHAHCFGCGYHEKGEKQQQMQTCESTSVENLQEARKAKSQDLLSGQAEAFPKRGLTDKTSQKWKYHKVDFNGRPGVHCATYCDENGKPVAQKLRLPSKDFPWRGDTKAAAPLYGMWMWKEGGKKVVVTEGEVDALSVSQLQDHKWPVVSLKNGAAGAHKDISRALPYLNTFDQVILMFDNDDPGQAAVEKCVGLFPPNKCAVARLPLKDANEMLVANRGKEVIDAIWQAKPYRPDCILEASELWDEFIADNTADCILYPWSGLNDLTHGLRKGELVTFTAGSGIGKSSACREIAYHLLNEGKRVGYIALEESVKHTLQALIGLELNKRLNVDTSVTEEEKRAAFGALTTGHRLYLYNHFGSLSSSNLLNHIRYLSSGLGVDYVVLDHLSIVVSGDDSIGDERRAIDITMTKLRSLVEETGIGMILVSHLKRPDGKGHEEGAQTSLSQLRGSAAIAQLSDMVLGLERNQQDPDNKHKTSIRVLKNRFSGETGEACCLLYDTETGRMAETTNLFDEDEEETTY